MENIVSTLIKQHRVLQQDVDDALALCNGADTTPFDQISRGIEKFKKDLVEHLDLENNTFYVELLAKMKEAGQDTAKTEQFIAEMKDIETVIYAFFDEFGDPEDIKENFAKFKDDFATIKGALTLRVESEEAGVYSYWGLF